MSAKELEALKPFAEALARQACQTVLALAPAATTEIKPDGSPVTSVDKAVEAALRQSIEHYHPDHGIVGEEYGEKTPGAEWVWVLDPIDGTKSFIGGLPTYAVLIALCRQGRPLLGVIAQPQAGLVYLGISGLGSWLNGSPIRSGATSAIGDAVANLADHEAHSAATLPGYEALRRATRWNLHDGSPVGYGALAAGRVEICLSPPHMSNYDFCAFVPVIEAAGGAISDWGGNPLTSAYSGEIVASANPELHGKVLALLAEATGA